MLKHHYIPLSKIVNRANKRAHLKRAVERSLPATLPVMYSLNKYRNFIYDQGQIGSCTSCAFCSAYRLLNAIHKKDKSFEPSRLFFYYQERVIENAVMEDSGADVIDGESYVKTHGICSEKIWPYNVSKFTIAPPQIAYVDASKHKISSYSVLENGPTIIDEIKHSLINNLPVLIAISVYDSFESSAVAKNGHVPLPDVTNETCLGGHEMCLIGYNDITQNFTVMNSWGNLWGDHGLCYIPYAYLSDPNLGQEFTVIEL